MTRSTDTDQPIDLHGFTTGLLGKLPFSISHREGSFRKEIDMFLAEAMEHSALGKVDFLSYSYAKLDSLKDWRISSLHNSFFYKDRTEDDPRYLLSLYYHFRKRIDMVDRANGLGHGENNAEVVATLFRDDTSFRVRLVDPGEPKFEPEGYRNAPKTYSITLPWSGVVNPQYIGPAFAVEVEKLKDELGKLVPDPNSGLLIRSQDREVDNVFVENEDLDEKGAVWQALDRFYETTFNETGIFEGVDKIQDQVKSFTSQKPVRLASDEVALRQWVRRFPSIGLFSTKPGCWTEYMPATCGWTIADGKREERNLGCLVFGYQGELDLNVRALLRMISVRISSVIAGSVVEELQREAEHQALNSAITQTAARNYAHHIGAHVKMRTTPQEIKKRIGDLYPGLKNLV